MINKDARLTTRLRRFAYLRERTIPRSESFLSPPIVSIPPFLPLYSSIGDHCLYESRVHCLFETNSKVHPPLSKSGLRHAACFIAYFLDQIKIEIEICHLVYRPRDDTGIHHC